MVEKLKIAIEKARAQRGDGATGPLRPKGTVGAPPPTPAEAVAAPSIKPQPSEPRHQQPIRAGSAPFEDLDDAELLELGRSPSEERRLRGLWGEIEPLELDMNHLHDSRIITFDKSETSYVAFDVLRTRIMRVFKKHGWNRLGITSPTKGCGKTFVTANLGLSFARSSSHRTILMDMDLRIPALAKTLGVRHPEKARWFLDGGVPPEDYLRRVGDNLAIGMNRERVRDAAEVILHPRTTGVLQDMISKMSPDIVVYDLPPMLSCDDVLGFLPQLDCILLVVAADATKPEAVTECERLLSEANLLGVLLNKAEDVDAIKYGYEYA